MRFRILKISAISKSKLFHSVLVVSLFGLNSTFSQTIRNSTSIGIDTKASSEKKIISSESKIDWSKNLFVSDVKLDTEKAEITMPSGKKAATTVIDRKLPVLIKDPLLSVYVNSSQSLGDLVLDDLITLEQLTEIIENGRRTSPVFENKSLNLTTTHYVDLKEISSLMVKHRTPYTNPKPIEQISSRAYSGIIIDARGVVPVHGEFVRDRIYPCFFPQIWDEEMNLIYERNMGNPEAEKAQGLVHYDWSENEVLYQDRIGTDPMHIRVRKVYGFNRTDPVISREDALKILTVPENLQLLREGKVVILLDKDRLSYNVGLPSKTDEYYASYRAVKEFLKNDEDPDDEEEVLDGPGGMQFLYDDLKFVADSASLLPSELPKIRRLAEALKQISGINNYTILIEGHTADVNKPAGQMQLSVERAQAIVNELVKNGLPARIFSTKGYGGTQPVASNSTAEGRAANRRVVVTARPNGTTYIQKD